MSVTQISIDDAKQKLDSAEIIIIDIRDITAYEKAHIENAIHLTADNFDEFCDHADKFQPVLVYCYLGVSSKKAAEYLAAQGFEEVYSLEGGFTAWEQKYPVEAL